MFTVFVEAKDDYDLRDAYDVVRDGLLDERLELVKIEGEANTPGLFSGGDGTLPAFKAIFTAKLREVPDDEYRAYILAKMREIFGDKAVIRFEVDEQ